jgi:vancomycin resistance protein YoaR
MAAALTFVPRRDPLSGPQLDVHVDAARLATVLGAVNAGVATAPADARFVVQGDRVTLVPAVDGRRVDTVVLAQAIERRGRAMSMPVPTQAVAPRFSTADAQAMGIKELILSHSTYFPGSSQARLTNIHAAVQHLDGQLIAPGAVFSFDQRIGDITPQGGYVQGINIIDNQDVPGIGGGVCQVAVTLFQAAVYSGMEILERIPHANIVSYYNPVGMDATVYVAPGGPDVKFENNSGHWVLIDFVEDLANDKLTVRFFGTDPHFRVVVRGPIATYHKNGDVDAVFYRTVYDASGKVLLDAHFNSHYVPTSAG